jgi:putative protein-disulfide isomerase
MEIPRRANQKESAQKNSVEQIEITFYTDPICCWSWALEKSLSRLREEYDGVKVRYVLYAMITDWDNFHDPVNSVSTPAQMGPVWMHASAISGVPMNDKIWYLDPPTSSVPAALAVKCAGLQSKEAGDLYFKGVREALMVGGKNISKTNVLYDIADTIEAGNPTVFSADVFRRQMKGPSPLAALKRDMDEATVNKVGRFPTLIIKSGENQAVLVTGYRPYDVLLEAIRAATPVT